MRAVIFLTGRRSSFLPADATRMEYDETPEKSVTDFLLGKRGIDSLVWLQAPRSNPDCKRGTEKKKIIIDSAEA